MLIYCNYYTNVYITHQRERVVDLRAIRIHGIHERNDANGRWGRKKIFSLKLLSSREKVSLREYHYYGLSYRELSCLYSSLVTM